MRVGCHILDDYKIFHSVNGLFLVRLDGGPGEKFCSGRNVNETHGMGSWMKVGFHSRTAVELPLARFEAGIGFANDIDPAFAADYLAIRMPVL